ncbi:hypothetical protein EV128_1379 [Rhizobium azibense]|nr:hypothetical protein EV128_1379 [Rhizobium azibense]
MGDSDPCLSGCDRFLPILGQSAASTVGQAAQDGFARCRERATLHRVDGLPWRKDFPPFTTQAGNAPSSPIPDPSGRLHSGSRVGHSPCASGPANSKVLFGVFSTWFQLLLKATKPCRLTPAETVPAEEPFRLNWPSVLIPQAARRRLWRRWDAGAFKITGNRASTLPLSGKY